MASLYLLLRAQKCPENAQKNYEKSQKVLDMGVYPCYNKHVNKRGTPLPKKKKSAPADFHINPGRTTTQEAWLLYHLRR